MGKLEAAILRQARSALLARRSPVVEAVKRIVPFDTGSLESTVRTETTPDGFDLLIGGIQGSVNFVDYQNVVNDRQGFVEAAVVPAIRDELVF